MFHKGDWVYYPDDEDEIKHERKYKIIEQPKEDDEYYKTVQFEDGEEWGIRLDVSVKSAVLLKEGLIGYKIRHHDELLQAGVL